MTAAAIAGGLLLLYVVLAWLVSELEKEEAADLRRQERARIARIERLAAGRISAATSEAMQRMAGAAGPHGVNCHCARCIGKGGRL